MRIESAVTSLSWIPSEAVTGLQKPVFDSGVTHYDAPPPEAVDDARQLEALRAGDRFRFANRLEAWIEVQDGRIVDAGYRGGGRMGSTTVRVAALHATFEAVGLPDIQHPPEIRATSARFVQTTGGRTAVPFPRRVRRPPFVQFKAPLVWTTLALTLNVDGTSSFELIGSSPFPRHWVYGPNGKLAAKAATADFKAWYKTSFGKKTPWGNEDSKALVTQVETALERELSTAIMQGGQKPAVRSIKRGALLVEQGATGRDLFLLLDGVLSVDVDGTSIGQVGPGAILGERAVLEGGTRTATLRALTACRVAVAAPEQVDRDALVELSKGRRREERP